MTGTSESYGRSMKGSLLLLLGLLIIGAGIVAMNGDSEYATYIIGAGVVVTMFGFFSNMKEVE